MFEVGTTEHWWPVAKRYPVLSNHKQILKPLGYAHMINLIETFNFKKILEVGHGSGSYLFDIFKDRAELWGLDDTIENNRVPSELLKEMIDENPHVKFVRGLLGDNIKELPDNYFDFVCSVSVLEHIPVEAIPSVFEETFRILKPGGVFSHSFDISYRKNTRYVFDAIEKSGFDWLKPKASMNVFWEGWLGEINKNKIERILEKIVFENPNVVAETFMWENERSQRKSPTNFLTVLIAARKPDSESKALSSNTNISQPSVSNFDNYTFSKKSHFEFFTNNEFDKKLFDRKTDIENSDLKEYQNLLCYSFILENIKPGSKILKIGSTSPVVVEKIKKDYHCSVLLNNEDENLIANREGIKIIRGVVGSNTAEIPDNYYDFVFSTSLSESPNMTKHSEILKDINRIIKPEGYALLCNVFLLKEPGMWIPGFMEYILENQKSLNTNIKFLKILLDPDLHTMDENYFKNIWEPVVGKPIEEFGNPFSYNILWSKV